VVVDHLIAFLQKENMYQTWLKHIIEERIKLEVFSQA
jgi:hypothetical protein